MEEREDQKMKTNEELVDFKENLFKEYYEEAKRFFEKKENLEEGSKKLGRAINALIKLVSNLKHITHTYWFRGTLDNVIYNNLSEEGQEGELRKILKPLYRNGHTFHKFFYEGELVYSKERIKETYEESKNLIKQARNLIEEVYDYTFQENIEKDI